MNMNEIKTPALDKLLEVQDQMDLCRNFLEYFLKNYSAFEKKRPRESVFADVSGAGDYINVDKLLADFFEIDRHQAEKEREALLDSLKEHYNAQKNIPLIQQAHNGDAQNVKMIVKSLKEQEFNKEAAMKDVCIAYADKSGNGFSVSEPWIEDNFNTLEDCEQKASDLKKEGYQHVILFYKGEEELESYSWEYVEQHKI